MTIQVEPSTTQVGLSTAAFAAESGQQVAYVPAPATPAAPKFYTEEEFVAAQEAARAQEKSKLYPDLQETKTRLAELERQRTEEATARTEAERLRVEAEAATERSRQESELDAKSLLELRTKEWEAKLAAEQRERESAFALLDKERQYGALQTFKQNLIAQESVNIVPQLIDFVSGNTPDEIQASIEDLKARSEVIFQDAQTSLQNERRNLRGVSVTAPTSGPLDTNSGQRTFSPDDIKNMSMEDFGKNRQFLMSSAAQGKTSGLFG